jgi:phosphoribosylamine--glycine ligase
LAGYELAWSPRWSVTLVLASAGYPERPSLGETISGLDRVSPGVEVTHAGTARRDREIVTSGGRVLGVTALGEDPAGARSSAYAAAQMIDFAGKQLRTDIAAQAVAASPGGQPA